MASHPRGSVAVQWQADQAGQIMSCLQHPQPDYSLSFYWSHITMDELICAGAMKLCMTWSVHEPCYYA